MKILGKIIQTTDLCPHARAQPIPSKGISSQWSRWNFPLILFIFIYSFLQTKRVSQNQNYNKPNLNARTVHYTKLQLQA